MKAGRVNRTMITLEMTPEEGMDLVMGLNGWINEALKATFGTGTSIDERIAKLKDMRRAVNAQVLLADPWQGSHSDPRPTYQDD